jgi:hypothetical protein
MFVAGELRAEASFAVAQARFARLGRAGGLLSASQDSYGAGLAVLVAADPPGRVPQVARLVRVCAGNLAARSDSACAPLRWEAIAPGGDVFPALDADLTLRPAANQATTLILTAAYRPPPGSPSGGWGHVVEHRVATATIEAFLNRVCVAITTPGPASTLGGGADQGGIPPAAQAP